MVDARVLHCPVGCCPSRRRIPWSRGCCGGPGPAGSRQRPCILVAGAGRDRSTQFCRFAEGWDPAVAEAFPPAPRRRDVPCHPTSPVEEHRCGVPRLNLRRRPLPRRPARRAGRSTSRPRRLSVQVVVLVRPTRQRARRRVRSLPPTMRQAEQQRPRKIKMLNPRRRRHALRSRQDYSGSGLPPSRAPGSPR